MHISSAISVSKISLYFRPRNAALAPTVLVKKTLGLYSDLKEPKSCIYIVCKQGEPTTINGRLNGSGKNAFGGH